MTVVQRRVVLWTLLVRGSPRGVVYKKWRRWRWQKDGRGAEVFPSWMKRDDVLDKIADICLCDRADVRLSRRK